MSNIKVTETKLQDVKIIEPAIFGDHRGFFTESYSKEAFASVGIDFDFVQDNHSCSQKGVLRGLHYQLDPYAQGKLVRVVQGRAWDVAVDIREGSPTFGQWVGLELTGDNHKQFWIPAGFAHGFVALEDNTQFLYKATNYYNQASERAIVWNDEDLAIDWQVSGLKEILVSEKDKEANQFSKI